MVGSPTIELLDRDRKDAHPAGNGEAHFQQVLKHVFLTRSLGRRRQGNPVTYCPEPNNEAQYEAYYSKGGFEHTHLPFPPEGRTMPVALIHTPG